MRRSSVAALLALAGLLAGLVAAGPARAAVATPYTPAFGAGIDRYSSYEPENTCSPTAKGGTAAWRDLLLRTYGSRWNNISRACSASDSGHEEGRALDWRTLATDPTQKAQGDALLAWLLATDQYGNTNAMARRLGIQYIQFNNRMWRSYNPGAGWLPETLTVNGAKTDCAKLGASYVTSCHRDHIHFSFGWAGANKKTSWFTGSVPCAAPADPPAFTAAMPTNMTAVPVAPVRLLNTRSGAGACRLAPKGRLDLKVTGVGGVPATGVGAVAINVSGIRPSGAGTYLSAYPTGTTFRNTSTLQVPVNGTSTVLATVPVGSNGMVSIYNSSAPVDVAVDVVAYFTTASTGSRYSTVPVQRVLATGPTTAMSAGERRVVQVAGSYGVPAGAAGVLVNVTSAGSAAGGYLALASTADGGAGTSNLSYPAGETVSNRALTRLAQDGTLVVYSSAATDVTIDLMGWFGSNGALRYNALAPTRILDTRNGTGGVPTLTDTAPAAVTVAGRGGVPADAVAVTATLTVLQPTARTDATMWPAGRTEPAAADLAVAQGGVRANLVSPVLAGGGASLSVDPGSANAVLDVLGYFRA